MKIMAIRLKNIRGFTDTGKIVFSKSMNVFTGFNNAGKSTIIRSIFQLQKPYLTNSDLRVNQKNGRILIYAKNHDQYFKTFTGNLGSPSPLEDEDYNLIFDFDKNQGLKSARYKSNHPNWSQTEYIKQEEPHNAFYPFLSKRKVLALSEQVDSSVVNSVPDNFQNLSAKVDRLASPENPHYQEYVAACNGIIGSAISSFHSPGGKKAGKIIDNQENISIESMGDGVTNILSLITNLCVAKDKIFLIEEPETDLHPRALKKLLKLIIDKSSTNQFFISTHSNIAVKYLGSESGSKLFNIELDWTERIPRSTIDLVGNDVQARRKVLEDLGYDFFDSDLWNGWIFFEESSAEELVRDYFFKWFFPNMVQKVRTFSANGNTNIEPKFEDFNRLFVYAHLEQVYKNRAWVLIDGDDKGRLIVDSLKQRYSKSGWQEESFQTFSEPQFEKYYPNEFKDRVESTLSIADANGRKAAKALLLRELKDWISTNETRAKSEFEKSAGEVVSILRKISTKFS